MYEVNEICKNGESLSLTTDGQLRIVFLGTGSAFSKRNRQSNFLIIQGDHHILVDCGSLGPLALEDLGLNVLDVRYYLPTHSHADHIGGFEEVGLMGRYTPNTTKPRMIISRLYQKNLWDKTLAGGMEYCEGSLGKPLKFTDFFETLRPKPIKIAGRRYWSFKQGPIEITIMRTRHFPDTAKTLKESQWCCGVMINNRVWISGDTMFDDDYPKRFSESAEVMFHDCQMFVGGVHASYEELMTLPEDIRKKMLLYHYGDNWDKPETWVKKGDDFTGDPAKDGFLGWAQPQVAYDFS